jgi:DNA-binding LytR/AlgR family response regulator
MPEHSLEGRRILVVEDEYLIADEMRAALIAAGAEVLGPVPNVEAATALISAEHRINGALLDINLGGTMVFDVADALAARGVPFAFVTGYDDWAIPQRFARAPRLEKPVRASQMSAVLAVASEPGRG